MSAKPSTHKTRVWETKGWHEGSDGVDGMAQEMNKQWGCWGGLRWKEEYGLVSAAKEYTRDEQQKSATNDDLAMTCNDLAMTCELVLRTKQRAMTYVRANESNKSRQRTDVQTVEQ